MGSRLLPLTILAAVAGVPAIVASSQGPRRHVHDAGANTCLLDMGGIVARYPTRAPGAAAW